MSGRPRLAGWPPSWPAPTRLNGAALPLAGVALYAWAVGVSSVIGALDRVPLITVVALALGGFLAIGLWGVALSLALDGIGIAVPRRTAVLLFASSVFFNGVTPFGQVGGDPPSGLLIAEASEAPFEAGLAAIASVNALNRVAVVLLGVAGAAWLAVRATAPAAVLEPVAAAAGVVTAAGVLAWFVWRRRAAVSSALEKAIAVPTVRVAEWLPAVDPPTSESVVGRVRGFVAALERLGSHPAGISLVFLLGVGGQVVVAGVLWIALNAVGAGVAPGVALVVIPAAKLSGFVPTPGGAVGATVLLSGLLGVVGGVALADATAAAVLYRAAAFWVPTMAGGVATATLVVRSAGPRS